MGRREDDLAFAVAFAKKRAPFYASAKQAREVYRLAEKLGMTSAGLGKYMSSKRKPVPKLRMVVLANKNLGIAIPYGTIEPEEYLSSTRVLPVRVEVSSSQGRVDFSGAKKLPGSVELLVDVTSAKASGS